MNIENISALAGQLQLLGFENVAYPLLKRITFKPENFTLSQNIEKGKDKLLFQLFFERSGTASSYSMAYYDVTLQKEAGLNETVINDVSIANLEKLMSAIDWRDAFDFFAKGPSDLEDKTGWDKEEKIESVIEKLYDLEKSEEGTVFSIGLKLKFWTGLPYQELFGNINPVKNKSEVNQRFYFFESQVGISVDEAYRFLQNRWQEKQYQLKKKNSSTGVSEPGSNDDLPGAGSGLLTKRRQQIKSKGTRKNLVK